MKCQIAQTITLHNTVGITLLPITNSTLFYTISTIPRVLDTTISTFTTSTTTLTLHSLHHYLLCLRCSFSNAYISICI